MKKSRLPIDDIISKLGYTDSANLIKLKQLANANLSPRSRKIISEIKPYAAYIVDGFPFILFFDSNINDITSFKEISKRVWNAQIPIVIFCQENTVKIFNGTSLDLSDYTLKQVKECLMEDCTEYADFSFWQISNQKFWNKYIKNFSEITLNKRLLENISFLTDKLKTSYNIEFATKLVLRLIFIRYLIDRGVDLDYKDFSEDIKKSQEVFLRTVRNKEEIYKLFLHLKEKFNGNLFDLEGELECEKLTKDVFTLLADFLSGKEVLNCGQLSLFSLYDFNIIPVELISNIYEILLGKEIREKDNAFYTPNYLVEYILDKTVTKVLTEKSEFTILDPSCGSGVFLVDSYRRIIETNLGENLYCDDDDLLKQLLTRNIYGIDINEEAIDVTIFSLYLTILDYKDPKTLSQFTLPNLKGTNLFASDFFDQNLLKDLVDTNVKFDFIIGNPPWGNIKGGLHMIYCRDNGYNDIQQNNEICRSFVLRAKDFSTENTICCFILHSKLLYNQEQPAINFRKFLLKNTKIHNIVELSSVRKLVFENADAPAVIISFNYNQSQKNLSNRFTYISIKPNVFFKLFHIMVIEKNDVKFISQKLLYDYDWAWKTIVFGFSRDIDNIIKLKANYTTVDESLKSQNPPLVDGTGISYQNGNKDARELISLGIPIFDSKNGIDHFWLNSEKTIDFKKKKIYRTGKNIKLFSPPYCLTTKGLDTSNYTMRSVYSEEPFIFKDGIYIIKGTDNQKEELLNLTGLFNSLAFSYFQLMLGSSVGIEREQRFMAEIRKFPYVYDKSIAMLTNQIQQIWLNDVIYDNDIDELVCLLNKTVLSKFSLENDVFVDYAINVQIPELATSSKIDAYRKISIDDLRKYSLCFERQFTSIYNQMGKQISIRLYPHVGRNYSVFELRITNEGENCVVVYEDTENNKELLSQFAVYAHNDKFYTVRDVIHFGEDYFYIIKPNYYKNWHPAIAELDLSEIIDEIMSSTGGEE